MRGQTFLFMNKAQIIYSCFFAATIGEQLFGLQINCEKLLDIKLDKFYNKFVLTYETELMRKNLL